MKSLYIIYNCEDGPHNLEGDSRLTTSNKYLQAVQEINDYVNQVK